MTDDMTAKVNPYELQKLKKQYKKLKRYMKSPIYQIKMMDGTEKTITNLLKESENVSNDTK